MSIFRWILHNKKRNNTKKKADELPKELWPNQILEQHKNESLSPNLENSVDFIRSLLHENEDFVVRKFHVFGRFPAAMLYFSNLVDQINLNLEILKPLMSDMPHIKDSIRADDLCSIIFNDKLCHSESRIESNMVNIVETILSGGTVVLVNGLDSAFLIGTRKVEKRSITQPPTEQVIRGPREGFIEPLSTNISLLRYRLQTPNFIVY